MADFRVFVAPIEKSEHPNADSLAIGKVGSYQIVFGKNNYKDGDLVCFAPARSLLPLEIHNDYKNSETGKSYLVGPNNDRISEVKLRGETSEGVTLNPDWVCKKLGVSDLSEVPLNEDLSEKLGITKYEPPLPIGFGGELKKVDLIKNNFKTHDVEGKIYAKEFISGELIRATEKLHGSSCIVYRDLNGEWYVTSKGFAKKQIFISEDEKNIYWQSIKNSNLINIIEEYLKDNQEEKNKTWQIFGECFPCQKGFNYGTSKPDLRLFRVIIDGVEQGCNIPKFLKKLWVPIIYDGPFDLNILIDKANGKEQISGKELHISEGIVLQPFNRRKSSEGWELLIKILNKKYKEDEEAFN